MILRDDLAVRGLDWPLKQMMDTFVGGTMANVAIRTADPGAAIPDGWGEGRVCQIRSCHAARSGGPRGHPAPVCPLRCDAPHLQGAGRAGPGHQDDLPAPLFTPGGVPPGNPRRAERRGEPEQRRPCPASAAIFTGLREHANGALCPADPRRGRAPVPPGSIAASPRATIYTSTPMAVSGSSRTNGSIPGPWPHDWSIYVFPTACRMYGTI